MTWKANLKYGSHGSEKMWICTDCGFQVMNLSEYCPHCGIKTGYEDPKDRSLIAAAQLIKENCIERTREDIPFPDGCMTCPFFCPKSMECAVAPEGHDSTEPHTWEV